MSGLLGEVHVVMKENLAELQSRGLAKKARTAALP